MSNYLKHKLGSIEEVIAKQTSSYREDSLSKNVQERTRQSS